MLANKVPVCSRGFTASSPSQMSRLAFDIKEYDRRLLAN